MEQMTNSNWSIIVPVLAINLIINPSIEVATTNYNAMAGAIARVVTYQRRGYACLSVTPAAGVNDGMYYGTVGLTNGQSYTFSCDVLGVLNVPYRIYFATTAGTLKASTEFTGTGEWQRVAVTWEADATANHRLYVTKNDNASTGVYYVDGMQVCNLAYDVMYIDGDQAGCTWSGAAHGSTSTRPVTSRAGGRVVNLSSYGAKVTGVSGLGVPPLRHLAQERAILPGALYNGSKYAPRVIDMSLGIDGSSLADLHDKRNDLIDAIDPDGDPAMYAYSGAGKSLYITAAYDGGLEFRHEADDGFTEDGIPLRLIAYDPYWSEDGQAGAALTDSEDIADANYIIGRVAGQWQALSDGTDGTVYTIVSDGAGNLYVGGQFTTAGGVAVNNVAKWDGTAFTALDNGLNNAVVDIAIDAAGQVYAVGKFTDVGGGTAGAINYAAVWNGSSWAEVGDGLDNAADGVAVGPDGYVYIVGRFTDAGTGAGVVASPGIVRWTGTAWQALGTAVSGASNTIYPNALTFTLDGDLVIGGNFTTAGGIACNGIARWDGSAWNAMGQGLTTIATERVITLVTAPNGVVYAGGDFVNFADFDADYVAAWNGANWEPLGDNLLSGAVYHVDYNDGLLYASGNISIPTAARGADKIATWNGSAWAPLDINLPGAPIAYAFEFVGNDLYIGYDTAGTAVASAVNTITNPGAKSYPKMIISRSGGTSAILSYLESETIDVTVTFNYSLLDGEELTIDFDPDNPSAVSSLFGASQWGALTRGAQPSRFYLAKGSNVIALRVVTTGTPTITARLIWPIRHLTADAGAA
jgi:hypothetical protein